MGSKAKTGGNRRRSKRPELTLFLVGFLMIPGLGPGFVATSRAELPATSGNRTTLAREDLKRLLELSSRLLEQAGSNPALLPYSNDLARIDTRAQNALRGLDKAEMQAAEAWVEMACYAAWIVSRESKKKAASLRLIEITRATGKEGEIERYEARHEMLLAAIRDAVGRYEDVLLELGTLSAAAIEHGLTRHEEELLRRDLLQRVAVLNKVKEHLAEFPTAYQDGASRLGKWQRDLEKL